MEETTYTAFAGTRQVAAGPPERVLPTLKRRFEKDRGGVVLVFDDRTGRQIDFDLRGTLAEVLERARPAAARVGPGRPKLGVVAREVSLLPRHWEWLEEQPNGASAAIRRLVDEARKRDPEAERSRLAIAATSRFLSAIAGNLPGYEEATRALYNRDWVALGEHIRGWPKDIRLHTEKLLEGARS